MPKSLAVLALSIALSLMGVWVVGSQQPSRAIHQYERAIVVALKVAPGADARDSAGTQVGSTVGADAGTGSGAGIAALTSTPALWSARASHNLVGEAQLYWTHFMILSPGSNKIEALAANPAFDDVYAAEVQLTDVPGMGLGWLRTKHLLGITQRPDGPLRQAFEKVSDEAHIMPTTLSMEATLAMDTAQRVTMMNFLEYAPDEAGDKKASRDLYQRYGAEAMKAVYAVGGQLLFAGQVTRVLVPSKRADTAGEWDDLAAMIYPDPAAIFAMEQNEAYVTALEFRDSSLKRTQVVASVAQAPRPR